MNETELSDLMTAPGFFRFLAQQVKLDPEEVKRIYRLGTPWGLWPPDLDLSYETAEAGVDVFTYLAALQPLLDMDTKRSEEHTSELQSPCNLVCRLLLEKKKNRIYTTLMTILRLESTR